MPRYICKVSQFQDQCRITIPKALVKEMSWEDVTILELRPLSLNYVSMRRFVNGESLRTKLKTDSVKSG